MNEYYENDNNDLEDFEISLVDREPAGERCDPVGAANDHDTDITSGEFYDELNITYQNLEFNRIKSLEEEQEILTSSLLALTSHFAQVQFRLRQIVDAPRHERDILLKNLEEFAFRGIPDINHIHKIDFNGDNIINLIENQRSRQHELIEQLKMQLNDLEKYAYENGDIVLPQSILIEKQKIIISELKNKLNLNFDEIDIRKLSTDTIKKNFDTAIGEIVNPLKMKEQLVTQLKTQIIDLERFIAFLQDETNKFPYNIQNPVVKNIENDSFEKCKCSTSQDKRFKMNQNEDEKLKKCQLKENDHYSSSAKCLNKLKNNKSTVINQQATSTNNSDNLNNHAFSILSKASTLLQIFAMTQFGCGSRDNFQRNTMKKTTKGNHWGDIRAKLEIDIQEIISIQHEINLIRKSQNSKKDERQDNDIENIHLISCELTSMVRKKFSMTLKKLIQHGLLNSNETTSIVPFIGCFTSHMSTNRYNNKKEYYPDNPDLNNSDDEDFFRDYNNVQTIMHPWELILEYYGLKNGDKYNETPARKLSQSFNLDIVGGSAISNKQSLLGCIGSIIAIHSPYKRSLNSHFKAFVCAGLNSNKLVQWLNLIFQCEQLVSMYYTNWSYVSCTGFRDALKSMERLSKFHFDLPVDMAIRQFQNIKDVFM